MRDFLASRVVDGRQQIGTAITFHEYGRLVMWPYGYTYTNVPSDMTTDHHDALVLIGKKMAASNGYKPEQASDLYITSGTTRDPKGVIHSHRTIGFETRQLDHMFPGGVPPQITGAPVGHFIGMVNAFLVQEGKDPATFPSAVSTMALFISILRTVF